MLAFDFHYVETYDRKCNDKVVLNKTITNNELQKNSNFQKVQNWNSKIPMETKFLPNQVGINKAHRNIKLKENCVKNEDNYSITCGENDVHNFPICDNQCVEKNIQKYLKNELLSRQLWNYNISEIANILDNGKEKTNIDEFKKANCGSVDDMNEKLQNNNPMSAFQVKRTKVDWKISAKHKLKTQNTHTINKHVTKEIRTKLQFFNEKTTTQITSNIKENTITTKHSNGSKINLEKPIPTRRKHSTLRPGKYHSVLIGLLRLLFGFWMVSVAHANSPPRFIVDGGSEIVVHLKEGPETPVGSIVSTLRGYDDDGDALTFDIVGVEAKELLEIRAVTSTEAELVLRKLLDREIRDEFTIVLSLTDGKLGAGNYITQSLLLLVMDVNDNEPVFKPYNSAITVEENSPPKVLTQLQATDRDQGPYGQVVYTLETDEEQDQGMFKVSTVDGKAILRLTGLLDYETKSLYQLKVLAVDRSPSGRVNTGTAALVVRVKDVEDQGPEFIQAPPVTRIPEDIPVNSGVLQVRAVDGDKGVNNKIIYKIVDGGSDFFELETNSGVLYVKKPLDRERIAATGEAFFIKIMAKEVSAVVSPAPSTITEVTVVLEDVNDQTPTFRASHYVAEVSEGAQFNMPVNLIGDAIPEVYDNDQGVNGSFRLELSGAGDLFDVTPRDGINLASFLIRVKNPSLIDYEKIKVVNFTMIARETVADNPKSSSALVTVYLRDTNDNIPAFDKEIYQVLIREDAPPGTMIAKVNASDPDSGDLGTAGVRYTDLRGTLADTLELDAVSGEITLKDSKLLDREKIAEFFVTVEARDNLGKGNRNTVGLRIALEDVNDNVPVFLQKRYEVRVAENAKSFLEKFKVAARDDDLNGTSNHEVRYTIVGGDPLGNFSIDPTTGEVRLKAPLDFESIFQIGDIRFFNLTVKAYDLGVPPLSSLCQVLVYVADENDHYPKFDKQMYTMSIPEDTPGGTTVLRVHASDKDGSTANSQVFYRIQHGAQDKFVIEADTGTIVVARGALLDPDLSEPRTTSYPLEVIALDGGIGGAQLQSRTLVNISIVDVNNKPPVFLDPGIIRIEEDKLVGSYITRVEARDQDEKHNLKYSIDITASEGRNEIGAIVRPSEYNYASQFEIGETDGVIRLRSKLDREKVEVIRLSLLCEDTEATSGSQTATATLTIIVDDTNDNSPVFRKPFYKRSVAENAKEGTTITTVLADDIDKNKTISYRVKGIAEIVDLIHMDNATGEIFVKGNIDREQFNWLNFSVQATDFGFPPRSSLVDVFVRVLDENDNNPQFIEHTRSITVREDAPPGTEVIQFTAIDADDGDYGKITYVLDVRSSHGKFKIDPDSGVVTVSDWLNREEQKSFLLIIEAWDNYKFGRAEGDLRNAFTQINIQIADVNDEAPVFKPRRGCSMITEFHERNDAITVLRATDDDDPETPNGRIRFSILDGNELGLFGIKDIDITSAQVYAAKSLVGEYGNYTLMISAQDMGVPPNTATSPLSICVTDFNDHPPKFVSPGSNVTIRVPENATVGNLVIQVKATDEDIGINGEVRYRIKQDAPGHWRTFTVDQISGSVLLKRPLDRERQKIYEIRVEAYDQGVPTPLSTDLDLTIYVRNVNDYQPQFLRDVFTVNFTEEKPPGAERYKLLDTVDQDDLDIEEAAARVCYYVVGGDEREAFELNPITHEIQTIRVIDREQTPQFTLIVQATEDCKIPEPVTFFDPQDDTLLKVIIYINDINDNSPRFIREVFTGGITTASNFGLDIMKLLAIDPDSGNNAKLMYHMDGRVQETLTEGLDNLRRSPFLIDKNTGVVKLNFDPQKGMKGYFDFKIFVNDTDGRSDRARVFIYLLREDQRVRFILRQTPEEIRERIEYLRDYLGNVTGAIVNVDDFRVHENQDGTVDKTKTDLYLHLVDPKDNSVLEVPQVLEAIDKNVEHLDHLFKELNVLDTQRAKLSSLTMKEDNLLFVWLVGVIAFLALLLVMTLSLCLAQRARYARQLKAATATAFGPNINHSGILNHRTSSVPNTNLHTVEGSNPIWMSGFDNEWFKEEESLRYHHYVHRSDGGDSLDDNVVDTSLSPRGDRDMPYITHSSVPNPLSRDASSTASTVPPTNHDRNTNNLSDTYRANLYQTFNKMGNPLVDKKLETTEL